MLAHCHVAQDQTNHIWDFDLDQQDNMHVCYSLCNQQHWGNLTNCRLLRSPRNDLDFSGQPHHTAPVDIMSGNSTITCAG